MRLASPDHGYEPTPLAAGVSVRVPASIENIHTWFEADVAPSANTTAAAIDKE